MIFITCPKCGSRSISFENFNTEDNFECNDCNKKFTLKEAELEHVYFEGNLRG